MAEQDAQNILQEVEDIMSQNKLELPKNTQTTDNSNIDDGTILSLNNEVTEELDNIEKKSPDLSALLPQKKATNIEANQEDNEDNDIIDEVIIDETPIEEEEEEEESEEEEEVLIDDEEEEQEEVNNFIDEQEEEENHIVDNNQYSIEEVSIDDEEEEKEQEEVLINDEEEDFTAKADEEGDSNEAWQSNIKEELKEFTNFENQTEITQQKTENLDLDKDFGLENYSSPHHITREAEDLLATKTMQDEPIITEQDHISLTEQNEPKTAISQQPQTNIEDNKLENNPIISEQIYADSKNMIDDLKNAIQTQAELEQNHDKDANIEEFMIKMLKPMLKEWLDGNLPQIVKKIVQQEIKKIVK